VRTSSPLPGGGSAFSLSTNMPSRAGSPPRPRGAVAGAAGGDAAHTARPARISGFATTAGTRKFRGRFASKLAPDFFRQFPIGLQASSIGIGTYLGECTDADDESYTAAVRRAVAGGINLLDTAINYRCQRSERAVGRALRALVETGAAARDEIIVCTKGGYVPLDGEPPASREEYQRYLEREFYARGVMSPDDVVAGGHCLAPSYLAHQVARSRENLGVQTIDVYFLHNPEQQLDVVEPARFREVLREAFAALEARVEAGDIRCYGCATWNGLRTPHGKRGHLSLAELVEVAAEVAGDAHHFRVVQLPVNLAMTEAVRVPTQRVAGREPVPLLHAAAELGVSVVASASLMQAQLTSKLPPALAEAFPNATTDAQRAIGFVRSLPGLTTALVGMKSEQHVVENLGAGK
jgi:aryl-alcohol dehydrogenase-like predicted oxidoreductase